MYYYLIKFLRSLLCGVLKFVRKLTTSFLGLLNLRLRYIRQINMESDDECELDSTWEDEYKNKEPRKKNKRRSHRNRYAAKDMQDFRHRVRNLDDDDDDDDDDNEPGEGRFYNLEFYHGKINSSPDDVHIDTFHKQWKGQYDWLEDCHSYIQWLFPIQEPGVNWSAHVLTEKEIKLFRKDEEAKKKLVESYKLMLDFYGICLVNEKTGEVKRTNDWEERFSNLNRYSHNNLRITRILKCLGTLGLKHYQAPLVKFFLHETLVEKQLQRVKQSVLDYFMFTVLDKLERQKLVRFAFKHFKPREQFVWGPKKILSGEVYSKNEENKDNNTAEHKQQRETDNGVKDQQAINIQPVESVSDKNNEVEQDSDDNSQCSSGDKSVKKNQKVSVSDAKMSGEEHNESENFDHLTENTTTEGGQQKETLERTQELNQTDEHNPVIIKLNEKDSEKDQQAQDNQPIKNEQDPTENSSNTKKVEKQDQEKSNESNEEHFKPQENFVLGPKIPSGSEVVRGENENLSQVTEDKCSETAEVEQEMVKLHESTDEMSKIDANHSPEGMENETPKDNLNIDKPDSPNKLTGTNSDGDQGANEDGQCSSENKSVKQNQDMSDGDNDVGMTTENMSHDDGVGDMTPEDMSRDDDDCVDMTTKNMSLDDDVSVR
ncbi:opioid growth factor receptor-like protein 1 [Ctenopharyngodon idella]|uniref:opioid growth factor receptor-like protein 1 n=1 Tax=Ctenopharyngodon idella TaxID=7959 RepID=UPI00223120D1|nr:opioid growth factor receptor-like protein 1 [Ctenopharyngodon idella]